MLTPELELCEVSPTCGADVHKGVCPRNPANHVSHRIGPVGEPVPVEPRWRKIEPCRLGRVEYDGARYCHEHGGFLEAGVPSLRCNRTDEAAR